MRFLLDSHTLLWWLLDDPRLSPAARRAMAEHSRPVFVSAASTWEIGIKAAKGKLRLPSGGEERIKEAMVDAGFLELPVTWDHGLAVRTLADHHLDPFDRLLIIQSRLENLTMVTNDRLFPRYGIDVLW